MTKTRTLFVGALLVAGSLVALSLFRSRPDSPPASAPVEVVSQALAPDPSLPAGSPVAAPATTDATAADSPVAEFSQWAERYARADRPTREAMLNDGVKFAAARRVEMLNLIKTNPEQALREAVPYSLRRQLPAEIIALARPSRTASAARTSVESFLRRTP